MTQSVITANLTQRKARIRSKVSGTSQRPRLSVFISNKNASAQIIDDTISKTLVSSTTVTSTSSGSLKTKAAWVGADIAKKARLAKIDKVAMDRSGRFYGSRLKALADAARKEGLGF